MARDYAKKSRKRSSASRFDRETPSTKIPTWTWILASLLIGVILTFITVLYLKPADVLVSKKKAPEIKSAKSRYKAVPTDEFSDADFRFHNILKNKVVEVPKQSAEEIKQATPSRLYIMQCGSFRKIALAEKLKAQLAMNGFAANINATDEKSGQRWFRVTLGPFKSKRTAESQRHQLQRNNINTCQIW